VDTYYVGPVSALGRFRVGLSVGVSLKADSMCQSGGCLYVEGGKFIIVGANWHVFYIYVDRRQGRIVFCTAECLSHIVIVSKCSL